MRTKGINVMEALLKAWFTFQIQNECSLVYKAMEAMFHPRCMKMQRKDLSQLLKRKKLRRKSQSKVCLPTQVVLGGSPTQFGGGCKNSPASLQVGGFFL